MPRLVAFAGPAGSGKSTAAQFLIDRHRYILVKFATPLKSMLRTLYEESGLTSSEIAERLEGALKETPDPILNGKTPRFAMETLGTEWGRETISRSLWVDIWARRVSLIFSQGYNVVADDLRFPDELDMVEELGGIAIRFVGREQVIPGDPHPSRTPPPNITPIGNTGSKMELYQAVHAAINDAYQANDPTNSETNKEASK